MEKTLKIKPNKESYKKKNQPEEREEEVEGVIKVTDLTKEQLLEAIRKKKLVIASKGEMQAELDRTGMGLPGGQRMDKAWPGNNWSFNVSYNGYERRIGYLQLRVLFIDGNNNVAIIDLADDTITALREAMIKVGFIDPKKSTSNDRNKLKQLEEIITTLTTRGKL